MYVQEIYQHTYIWQRATIKSKNLQMQTMLHVWRTEDQKMKEELESGCRQLYIYILKLTKVRKELRILSCFVP